MCAQCMTRQFLKDCFFLNSVKKKVFKLFIFLWPDSLYTILKLSPYRKIFSAIYKMPVYFLTKKPPETVERGRLNLKQPNYSIFTGLQSTHYILKCCSTSTLEENYSPTYFYTML